MTLLSLEIIYHAVHSNDYSQPVSETRIELGKKMEKDQFRFLIRFWFLEENSGSEIKERLGNVYGGPALSMAPVFD